MSFANALNLLERDFELYSLDWLNEVFSTLLCRGLSRSRGAMSRLALEPNFLAPS